MARKILLADDSVTAQNMGRKILSDAGYDVITVNNGSAALKRVAELKPDLVVLDVYMPGYSGLEVCERLKDSPDTESIPVLLTVGKLEPFKPEEARRVRADAYIIKPFEASELLTALARMEDRMVPGRKDGSRLSAKATGVEHFTAEGSSRKSESEGETDTGWKSRLRFPSKKKKEEPEPEPDMDMVGGLSFRNFRRGKSKAPDAATGKSAASPLEAAVVPDIPRDITPEELDALSALAAKLDAPAAMEEEEQVAPAVETVAPVEAKVDSEAAAPAQEEKTEDEVPPADAEPAGEHETPATNALPEASAAVAEPEPVAVSEVQPTEPVHVETLAEAGPAPVDREDEPYFAMAVATAASVPEPVPQEENIEVREAAAVSSEAVAPANPRESIAIQAKTEEQRPDEPTVETASEVAETVKVEEPLAVEVAPKEVAPKIEETPKPEERGEEPSAVAAAEAAVDPAPTEEELAEALRLLTPALGHSDPLSMPTRETLVAVGSVLAEEAARSASEAPRWVAAAVTVSLEEAALSLETEMFRALAATAGAEGASVTTVTMPAVSPAAEDRTDLEAKTETPKETPAETMAGVSATASEVEELSVVEEVPAEQNDSPTNIVEESAEEPATATFADAVLHEEIEAVSAQTGAVAVSDFAVSTEEVGPPVVETTEVPISEAAEEGEEAMARERAKTAKSNWHQIRTGSAAPGKQDVAETKQAEPAEEATKAMAAAATADGAPTASAPLPDASIIASIVDSVLADLRPKIVEEIAKKLAGK